MASLYKRPKSKFWWIKYRDDSGKIRREATPYEWRISAKTRQARELEATKTLAERTQRSAPITGEYQHWVIPWLEEVYAGSDQQQTLTKYKQCWNALSAFLQQYKIHHPASLEADHIVQYLKWRRSPHPESGVRSASRNTALLDLRIMRIIQFEAMKRGYCSKNPCSRMKIKPDPVREKPELTAEDIQHIEDALEKKPEWMRVCWQIAKYQGCRMSETYLPLSNVDLDENTISFRIKRGKLHQTYLHPNLKPLFEQLIASGATHSYERPVQYKREWSRFFKKIKIPNATFHCTRVTVITILARAGVNEQQAMRYVGHSNTLTHRIYQRLQSKCFRVVCVPYCIVYPASIIAVT